MTRVTAPDGTRTDTVYNDRRTAVLDALGHQTIREVDAFGRLISVKQYTDSRPKNPPPPDWDAAVNFQAVYTYNVRDQLEKMTGSDGAVSDPDYDLLGRKIQLSDSDMGLWQYRYDTAGNLVKQRDARNQAICFYYDSLNRLRGKTYHAGMSNLDTLNCPDTEHAVIYGYDEGDNGRGRRTSMTDPSGHTSWSYDERGRVTEETKRIGNNAFTTGYSYRADDQLATLTYPDGEVLTYDYNTAGQLMALSGAQMDWNGVVTTTSYLTAATYTALGQPLSRSYGNGTTVSYGYHPTSYRLTSLTAPGITLGYTYYDNGNLWTLTDSGQATTFTYDEFDRLKAATGGYTGSYNYAPNGNLLSKTEGGATVNLSYPAVGQPRPHAPTKVNGKSYGYDSNGNLLIRSGQSFGYDEENRLKTVTQGGQDTTFIYDGDGNLVKRVTPEGTTLFVGPHYELQPAPASPPVPPPPVPPTPRPGLTHRVWVPLVDHSPLTVDGRPAQAVKYYLVAGQRIASWAGSTGTVTYYTHDHLGSTVRSSAGESIRYWPYGATRSGDIATAYQFTGQPRYATLGLDYFGARWYDPALGRFISADSLIQSNAQSPQAVLSLVVSYAEPSLLAQWNEVQRGGRPSGAPTDPQLLNRYSYARNNPLAYRDDTGHWIWMVVGGIGGAVVGFGAYALTHQDSFEWKQAALWAGGGALIGATLGGATELVVGAIGAQAAVTAGTTAATAACADGNCLNEAQATQRIIETGWTVIGKNPAYLDKARQLGASALNVSMEEWNALGSRAAQWARNVQFLDDAIARGDSFRLATSFAKGWAEEGTFYKQELVYLLQKGYELVTDINGAEWLIRTK